MTKILHIANDYAGSTVYMNLVGKLDNLGVEQVIYTPLREEELIDNNSITFTHIKSKFIYSVILNWHIDRVLYPYKLYKILKDIQRKVDFNQIDCIHAHTWYSDGGVAYFLAKKYNIPFIVTVRNTDLNLFQKKLVYLRPFGRKVLEKSKSIVLISASYKSRLLSERSLKKSLVQIKGKLRILPNGVDKYWVKNAGKFSGFKKKEHEINLIYVGRLTAGKNIPLLQEAVIELNKRMKGHRIRLAIVGGGGADSDKVLDNARLHPDFFTFHGKIQDKEKLANLYRAADIFTMPSSHETFGLVYVEAMLQGLPILYTANEGVDGFYSDMIGEKVQQLTVEEVTTKLIKMISNLASYELPVEEIKRNHDWAEIAKKYLLVYKSHI
ncbi:glycosyltransferase family 4 protein [Idiomarina piscisalsi]|uniref:glycosyltransferase family 4 protein n=1 Tax=Idiomarina piscisalsi TaxID=1096243 RepID=UPI001384D0B3|nr:glycosyltransferase family 4 protein [Idiomarina piscisalsi]MTJ02274.1 glycosyltransferase family 4 protein [Idiomarina piscisalsi]